MADFMEGFLTYGPAKRSYDVSKATLDGALFVSLPRPETGVKKGDDSRTFLQDLFSKLTSQLPEKTADQLPADDFDKLSQLVGSLLHPDRYPTDFHRSDILDAISNLLPRAWASMTKVVDSASIIDEDYKSPNQAVRDLRDGLHSALIAAVAEGEAQERGPEVRAISIENEVALRDRLDILHAIVGDPPKEAWFSNKDTCGSYADMAAAFGLSKVRLQPSRSSNAPNDRGIDVGRVLRQESSNYDDAMKILSGNPTKDDQEKGRTFRSNAMVRLAIVAQATGQEFSVRSGSSSGLVETAMLLTECIRGGLPGLGPRGTEKLSMDMASKIIDRAQEVSKKIRDEERSERKPEKAPVRMA